jgi:hypothetical protein
MPYINQCGRITAIAICLSFLLWQSTAAACLKYEPASVTLGGTIATRTAFGPPNYGGDPKHDSREHYLVLVLEKPICVDADPKSNLNYESATGVTAVQLIYFDKYPFLKEWLNKHVAVTGTLIAAETGHHHTPVLIQVTETRPVPN